MLLGQGVLFRSSKECSCVSPTSMGRVANGPVLFCRCKNRLRLSTAKGFEANGQPRLHEDLRYQYHRGISHGNLKLRDRSGSSLMRYYYNSGNNAMTQVSRNQPAEVVVSGLTSPPASSVSVNGVPATVYPDGAYALGNVVQSTSDTEQTVVVEATSPSGESVRVSEKYSLGFPLTGYTSSSSLSMTCTTDAAGNLSRTGDRWFQYDGAKQLIAVWEAGRFKTEYQYDGLNRVRVRKRFSSIRNQWKLEEERRYLYDGMQIVQERDGANQVVVSYTRGLDLSESLAGAGGIGGLLAFSDYEGPGVRHAHYHSDGNGNITAMMNRHDRLVAEYHYDPFANLQGQAGPLAETNPYRFSSKQYQPNTGMYSYGYRFYEPSLQRWINQDPMGEEGGINLYGFNYNDPVNYVDPTGENPAAILLPVLPSLPAVGTGTVVGGVTVGGVAVGGLAAGGAVVAGAGGWWLGDKIGDGIGLHDGLG